MRLLVRYNAALYKRALFDAVTMYVVDKDDYNLSCKLSNDLSR
jgi:hypothetical protein